MAKKTAIFLLIITFISCDKNNGDNGDKFYTRLNIPVSKSWIAHSGNPVVSFGDTIVNSKWDSPSVIFENGQYWMYMTGTLGDFGEDIVPFRANSDDGIQWNIRKTPVLAKGNVPTDIDFNGIESPSVVKFNGTYHMYYTVVPQDIIGSRSIGHATSNDGINWTKDPENPILEPTGNVMDWNGIQVAEPGAVVFDNTVFLYFSGQGSSPDDTIPANQASIGVSVSEDGFTFNGQQKALSMEMPYSFEDGFTGYGGPSALVFDDKVHLFFDVLYFNESENISLMRVALHHASSSNGTSGWQHDDQAIFTREQFVWARREIRAPSVLVNNNNLHLWFAGDDLIAGNEFWGIGYATSGIGVLD